jgi:plasmid stabilization system protein ParE
MASVRYTDIAEADLLDLWLTIAEDSPVAADRTLDALDRAARLLARNPKMGRSRPELMPGLRSFATSTPYILFYAADAGGIVVVRILHHARDIDAQFSDA